MIQGYRSIADLDALHEAQHRLLFQNALGVIEKVATTAPTATTLPVGYCQLVLISSVPYLYFNLNGTVYHVPLITTTFSYSQLNLSGNIVNADISSSAGIVYSKLSLTGSILNADLAGSIADSKLAQITTAGKVSTTAITGTLGTSNGGTGAIAAANAASGVVVLDASSKLPAVDGSQVTGVISQVNDTDTGTAFDDDPTVTFLSVDKTVTSGKTILLIATGQIQETGGIRKEVTLVLKQGSTAVQTVIVPVEVAPNEYTGWALSSIVTGLSGSITFSVTADSSQASNASASGKLTVLEF